MAKVAVATTDGVHIDGEFHMAKVFYIYEVNAQGKYSLVEQRRLEKSTGMPHEEQIQNSIDRLPGDVEGVLAENIDPLAARILYDKGIIALSVNRPVDYAVPVFGKKYRFLKRGENILRFCAACSAEGCGNCHSIL